jgi:peptidoglycan/LPS O-acetylase OafA/YrhL
MKTQRKTLLITSVLFMAAIWAFAFIEKGTNLFKGYDLIIFILIIVFGVIALVSAIKKDKDEKEGIPIEDELSNQIKYKAGYYAYLASLYMWLFIFLFKDKFPDLETLLGGGILLSALISYIARLVVKKQFHAK